MAVFHIGFYRIMLTIRNFAVKNCNRSISIQILYTKHQKSILNVSWVHLLAFVNKVKAF